MKKKKKSCRDEIPRGFLLCSEELHVFVEREPTVVSALL